MLIAYATVRKIHHEIKAVASREPAQKIVLEKLGNPYTICVLRNPSVNPTPNLHCIPNTKFAATVATS